MFDPETIAPEWLAIAAFLLVGSSAALFSLATFDADTPLKRLALWSGCVCLAAALVAAMAFISYPAAPVGYETYVAGFDCVRRGGE